MLVALLLPIRLLPIRLLAPWLWTRLLIALLLSLLRIVSSFKDRWLLAIASKEFVTTIGTFDVVYLILSSYNVATRRTFIIYCHIALMN